MTMDKPLRRILYVEDEDDIRLVAKMALETIGGYQVSDYASGPEGVAGAARAKADLLLLDVMMPGMDGPATLEALRRVRETAETPVIFMTAKVQPGEIEAYKALGAIGVIPKPFSPVDMPAEIGRLWKCAPEKAPP